MDDSEEGLEDLKLRISALEGEVANLKDLMIDLTVRDIIPVQIAMSLVNEDFASAKEQLDELRDTGAEMAKRLSGVEKDDK